MLSRVLALLVLVPGLAMGQGMPAHEVQSIEAKMAEWLAHPLEFGKKPKRTKYLASVQTRIAGEQQPLTVHFVEYEMPDGTYGKGFVNPVTWSFIGPLPYDRFTDVQLVTAYSGWLWLFSALNNRRAVTDFQPQTAGALVAELEREGITEVVIKDKYKVRTSEFFEFTGKQGGRLIKGAGSTGSKLVLAEDAPAAALPVVYTYLGMVMRGEI
jgi:hypothetical protein